MTNETELRDRIAEIVNAALVAWNTDMDTQDGEGEYAAQAIIDEFWLEVVSGGGRPGQRQQIVGRWEKQ